MTSLHSASPQTRIHARQLLTRAALTAMLAVLLNGTLYAATAARGVFPPDVIIPAAGRPMSFPPVMLASVLGVIGATLTLALLARLTRHPIRNFRVLGGVILLASFVTPFSIPNIPIPMLLTLDAMHVIVAVLCLTLLPGRAKEA
ncbi:hypothetical protein F8S09_17065 [Deinococcus sp. SDU3-2]|uniref:Uncharacterized protein n=1 Tax=Deinococcus terrestris TaxID=2651870 RepID=A0A7X1TTF8_9DEIO|nr:MULTISPECIES: DUF6069 family protein [Deinococcus]MPY68367.1 hypothetical protein [Deinococcus terrestris]